MWGRAGNQDNENIQKNKKNRKAAEDLKLIAMERLAESKARKWASLIDNDESPKKRNRSSGSDTLQYLLEKAENDRELKRQELELKMAIMLQLLQNKQWTLAYRLFPYFLLTFLIGNCLPSHIIALPKYKQKLSWSIF